MISATSTSPTPKPQFSTLSELLQDHKLSLKLFEGNVRRITVKRDEFWKEAIVTFKNPEFDYTATPRIVFEGEAGVDAGGLRREYGALLCQAIFSATANLFEGPEDRKLPMYSIDGIHSRLFQLAGSMAAYLIIHTGLAKDVLFFDYVRFFQQCDYLYLVLVKGDWAYNEQHQHSHHPCLTVLLRVNQNF